MTRPTLAQLKAWAAAAKADRIRTAPLVAAIEAAIAAKDAPAHFAAVNALRAAELPPMAPMTQEDYAKWGMRVK
jgi:hypothetical protein